MNLKSTAKSFAYYSLIAFLFVSAPVFAASTNSYLATGKPDGIALLPPPPRPGTAEYAADLNTIRHAFTNRTPAETAQATKDSSLSLFVFERAVGPFFVPGKFPQTEALYARVKLSIGDAINIPKSHWKRTRPYVVDTNLVFSAPERNFSYPSGHSARGTVYALVPAEVFPDKSDAILKVGEEIGWDRIMIGKHFPTDIFAGRVLAKAIFQELMASKTFQDDLAAAKLEAEAFTKATHN
jgi:acid phosphatase (class A)